MFPLAVLLSLNARHPSPSLGASAAAITIAVDTVLARQRPAGAAVGVVKDGQLVYVKSYGFRNIADREPVNDTTQFEIASVTKQFTAAAILQLQEAHKLSIDDKLSKYLPAFPHARQITLRQMLNQVSGLAEYLPQHSVTLPQGGLAAIAARVNVPLHFKPGTKWEYCNTNYYVLGKVVEKVSGMSWEAYVRQHLFAAAGMTHSAFIRNEPSLDDFAVGYWNGENDKLPLQPSPKWPNSWSGGAGAIVSTLADLAAWDTALTSGKIVDAADFTMMSTPLTLPNGRNDGYGMGLAAAPLDGQMRISHDGSSFGSVTVNAMYPNDHLDIIAFENTASGDPDAIDRAVLETILPEAAAASAPGETLAMRSRILHFLDETMSGALQSRELVPSFAKVATPNTQKHIAQQILPLGAPTAVIFKGKDETARDSIYHYRVAFKATALQFAISFDKRTHLVDGITLHP